MESMVKNMENQINDLKEAFNINAAKVEATAKKAEETKKTSDDRLFNLLENILGNKSKPTDEKISETKKNDMEVDHMNVETNTLNVSITTESTEEATPEIKNITTNLTGIEVGLEDLEIHQLPEAEEVLEIPNNSDENGTSVIDVDNVIKENIEIKKKVKYLEKCVIELNECNNKAVIHIKTVEKKFDDLLKILKNNKDDEAMKKATGTVTNTNTEKPYEEDNEKFPPLKKSYSIKVNKPTGNIIQSDPSLFSNPNMNEARIVTSKKKRHPNNREMLEKKH